MCQLSILPDMQQKQQYLNTSYQGTCWHIRYYDGHMLCIVLQSPFAVKRCARCCKLHALLPHTHTHVLPHYIQTRWLWTFVIQLLTSWLHHPPSLGMNSQGVAVLCCKAINAMRADHANTFEVLQTYVYVFISMLVQI